MFRRVHQYLDNPLQLQQDLRKKPESYWLKRGEQAALALFHQAAKRVPAYQNFLRQHHVNSSSIRTARDLTTVPPVSKDNYLRTHDRADLSWGGKFPAGSWTISSTSGSTGEPFYFPRQSEQDQQYATTAEVYLRSNFDIQHKSTLYVVAFPLGVWIGGMFTYEAIRRIANSGNYHLSIITPGINKPEIIKAVKNLGKDFDQVIIGSYAPFLKDILEDGTRAGIDWTQYNLGFIFAAEAFSETFRDYVVARTGLPNPYTRTINQYGTVDLGTMAHETPLSILVRRVALQHSELYEQIFGQTIKVPTLAQFLPEQFYFEQDGQNLYASARSGLPLPRYDLKDHGGVITLARMVELFSQSGLNLRHLAKEAGIEHTWWNLPFVYVYERSDFSVSFFAFQIYPETVRKAVQEEQFSQAVTGKFTMLVRYDEHHDQVFEVHIERQPGSQDLPDLERRLSVCIEDWLVRESSEYRKTREEFPDKVTPQVKLWPYEDPTYFRPGTKQQWVKRT